MTKESLKYLPGNLPTVQKSYFMIILVESTTGLALEQRSGLSILIHRQQAEGSRLGRWCGLLKP